MNIIEAKTLLGRILKTLFLCLLAITPFAPLLLYFGYRRLRRMDSDDPNYRFLKRVLTAGVAFLVFIGLYLVWRFAKPYHEENLPHVPWLPESARNISYYRSCFAFDAYEFDIAEADFKKMYKQKDDRPFQEIVEPRTIARFKKKISGSPRKEQTAVVKNGLFAEWEENGKVFHVVFDREKKRAYFLMFRREN